jgi:hypothetical protein
MSRSLSSLIQDVNALSHSVGLTSGSAAEPAEADPVAQIAAILNAHLAGLQWIEGASESLRRQTDAMEAKVKTASNGQWSGFKSKGVSADRPQQVQTPTRWR